MTPVSGIAGCTIFCSNTLTVPESELVAWNRRLRYAFDKVNHVDAVKRAASWIGGVGIVAINGNGDFMGSGPTGALASTANDTGSRISMT